MNEYKEFLKHFDIKPGLSISGAKNTIRTLCNTL